MRKKKASRAAKSRKKHQTDPEEDLEEYDTQDDERPV